MTYDLIIIGGGPAGTAAGVYAARKRIKTVLIAKEFGGQSLVSQDIQNFIGIVSLPGLELQERFKKHLEAYAEDILDIKEWELAKSLKKSNDGFKVATDKENTYQAKAVLVAAGSSRRKLKAIGADRLDNKGISYCASCDAPMFKGKDTVVIGGGNSGFEAAQQLLAYSPSVTLLEFGSEFKADALTLEQVSRDPKFKAITGAETIEIYGKVFVEGLKYKDRASGKITDLAVGGVFVEIGSIPDSNFLKDLLESVQKPTWWVAEQTPKEWKGGLDKWGQILVDHKTQRAAIEGMWAAGDITDVLYKQNNISMGDAVKALEDIYLWLQKKK
ncbi:FAD-dependent oxidoreductase [Patescibacteria group bacterium]|nr:FAD-dependent oxidoreductase [Patescibacteria group bacterium]